MSYEMSIPSQPHDILDDFSKVQLDPFIATVFEKVRTYNDLLQTEFVNSVQINEIMNELDDEWRMLMDQGASVTGMISFLPETIEGSEGEPKPEFYEEQEVEFGGVFPIRIETRYAVDLSATSSEDVHKYNLALRLTREGITPQGKFVTMRGTANIDELVSIEFPNLMSVERARNWLEYYHADDMQDIDVCLLNPGKEECEMVMRLADLVINTGPCHQEDDTMMLRSMQALNIYTNHLCSFDNKVPYHLSVSGEGWQPTTEGLLELAYLSGSTMASVNRLTWLTPEDESNNILQPHLVTEFLTESKDEPSTEMLVPLKSVVSLRSYRHHYFVGYSEKM